MLKIRVIKNMPDYQLNFNLQVEAEKEDPLVLLLSGPSGAGKTTLLRCVSGLEHPQSGVIAVNGTKFFDAEGKINLSPARRQVGYCFQNYLLFPHLTAKDNIFYGWFNRRGQQEYHMESLLEELREGLSISKRVLDAYPTNLSGGEQQRIALARALLRGEKLLLLDEPLNALDQRLREEVGAFILAWISQYNLPTIMVSHLEEDEAIFNKIKCFKVFLEDGQARSVDKNTSANLNIGGSKHAG